MRVLSEDEVTQTILEQGPLTAEELARLAYPVRVAYLALMFGWAKEHGLDNLVEQREILKPMVLRGLEETARFIDSFWERETGRPLKVKTETTPKSSSVAIDPVPKASKKRGRK